MGGIDRVLEVQELGNEEFTKICEHILHYCDLEEGNEGEGLPNF